MQPLINNHRAKTLLPGVARRQDRQEMRVDDLLIKIAAVLAVLVLGAYAGERSLSVKAERELSGSGQTAVAGSLQADAEPTQPASR